MGEHKKIAGIMAVCMLVFANPETVCAADKYRTRYEVPAGERGDYTALIEKMDEYEVREGDSLWTISEKLLGDGAQYMQLARQNAALIADPDLIYPQMRLQVARTVYVKKRTGDNGIETPEYRFGTEKRVSFGILESGEAFANCAMYGSEGEVICLIRDKEPQGEKALADWEKTKQTIASYVQKNFDRKVSDLAFHEYEAEDGRKLYLFTYVYQPDDILKYYVCEGICQTDHIQAEFTGFDVQEDVEDLVRYMLASFEELGENGQDTCSVNGYNIQIAPCEPWAVSGIHNSFVWVDTYLNALFEELSSEKYAAKKPSARERILDR